MEHVARTRPQRIASTTSTTGSRLLWEVVCPACGDDEGPADEQNPRVQDLRGPYATFAAALLAATRHERQALAAASSRDTGR